MIALIGSLALALVLGPVASKGTGCEALTSDALEVVPYCDLVKDPGRYDNRLILTEAIWTLGHHTAALVDDRCYQVDGRAAKTAPHFPEDSDLAEPRRQALLSILRTEAGAARVVVAGRFRVNKAEGPEGQRFDLEVICLMSVRAMPPGYSVRKVE